MNVKWNLILAVSLIIASFGSSVVSFAQDKRTKPKAAVIKRVVVSQQEIQEGAMLISKSDCLACHNAENKMVGPAYKTISQTYPLTDNNVMILSQKIISGGSGKWGQVPMPPHSALSPADSKKMVKYILSLRN